MVTGSRQNLLALLFTVSPSVILSAFLACPSLSSHSALANLTAVAAVNFLSSHDLQASHASFVLYAQNHLSRVLCGKMKPAHFSLEGAIRPNVIALPKFITSTSDEIQARRKILLDANENSLGTCLESLAVMSNNGDTSSLLGSAPAGAPPLNRYPSASQAKLKGLIADSKKEWGMEMFLRGTFSFLIR